MGTNAQVSLNGKTANELRELIAAKTVTAKVVVEFLQAKPKLRVPSQKLLEELTGKPASEPKSEKTKAPEPAPEAPKAEKPKAEVNPLEARVSALETAVAILMAARGVETAKPEPTPEPAKATEPEPETEVEDEDEDEDDSEGIPTEGSVREYLNGLTVKELRQHAKECGIPASGSKETLVSAIIAKAYEVGEIVADGMYEQLMAEIDGVEVF